VAAPAATTPLAANLDPHAVAFYRDVIAALRAKRIGLLVGGAWAFEAHTGISGRTKDLDLFLRPRDVEPALAVLEAEGYRTELTSPVWIAKAFLGHDLVDLIFSSGNGLCTVDDEWFTNAPRASVLGLRMRLIPIEEMIWSKSFLMERDRFDGADVNHLILAAAGRLDGERLLKRFGVHWRVLLAHVVLFDYVFPGRRDLIPDGLRRALLERATDGWADPDGADLCYGTFLSRHQYVADVTEGPFTDARHA
jgi:Nucleotidyl transferase of unknown function (DUF2204)